MKWLLEKVSLLISYKWMIVAIVWISGFVYFLNYMTIGTLAPFIKPELQISSAKIGLLCSAVTIGSMIMQIPAGIMCDRASPRLVMGAGLSAIAGSAFVISWLRSYEGIFLFLVILGLGVGCNQAPPSKAILVWFPTKGRATAMGIKQTGIAAGGMVASVLLPSMAIRFSGWRASFQIAACVALVSAFLIFLLYEEPPFNSETSEESGKVMKATYFSLVRNGDFILICLAGILLMIVQYSFSAYFMLYCNTVLDVPVEKSGVMLSLSFIGGALGRIGWSLLSDYVFGGRRKPVLCCIGIIGALLASAFIPLRFLNHTWPIYTFALLFGFVGMGWNAIYLTIGAEFPEKGLATSSTGMLFLVGNLGVLIGPPFFGYLVDITGKYDVSWFFVSLCMIMVTVLTKLRKKERMVSE